MASTLERDRSLSVRPADIAGRPTTSAFPVIATILGTIASIQVPMPDRSRRSTGCSMADPSGSPARERFRNDQAAQKNEPQLGGPMLRLYLDQASRGAERSQANLA